MSRNGRNPKSPAFQMYPGDFLADPKVQAMTTEEVGAYCLLILQGWIDGGVPNDMEQLARQTRLSPKKFASVWKRVGQCFVLDESGRFRNPRQERERQFQSENRKRLQDAANATNAKRWGSPSDTPSDSVGDTESVAPNTRYPTPDVKEPPTPRKRGPRAPFVPAWPPALDTPAVKAAWAEWEQYRTEKGQRAYTPTGFARIVNRYASPQAFVRDVQYSIESNWQGIHPCKGGPSQTPTTPTVTASQIATFQ